MKKSLKTQILELTQGYTKLQTENDELKQTNQDLRNRLDSIIALLKKGKPKCQKIVKYHGDIGDSYSNSSTQARGLEKLEGVSHES